MKLIRIKLYAQNEASGDFLGSHEVFTLSRRAGSNQNLLALSGCWNGVR
jgi:hypothetical protein